MCLLVFFLLYAEELLCGTSKVLDLLCRQINPEEESELIPLEGMYSLFFMPSFFLNAYT